MADKNDICYVQYGCGWSSPDGWVNFDASPTLRFERLPVIGRLYIKNKNPFPAQVRYGDIIEGLPIHDGSVKGVYASHILEHLSYEDFKVAHRNTYRNLQDGGIFRCLVPDLESRARYYIECLDSTKTSHANDEFMVVSHLGKKHRGRGLRAFVQGYLGNSSHLWMYDSHSMQSALKEAGFKNIRPCEFNDCEDIAFKMVEDEGRFFWKPNKDEERKFKECCFESRK